MRLILIHAFAARTLSAPHAPPVRQDIRQRVCQALVGSALLWAGASHASASAHWAQACGLQDWIHQHRHTTQTQVLALLSPRMPMSFAQWPRMRDAAVQAGFQVHLWRDPRVSEPEWRAAWSRQGWADWPQPPHLPLSDAAACPLLNHSPAFVLARCGQLHPWPLWGVMPTAAWLQVLHARKNDLKLVPCH